MFALLIQRGTVAKGGGKDTVLPKGDGRFAVYNKGGGRKLAKTS